MSSIPGLDFAGFASATDVGPFFSFTRGCTTAAVMIVDDLARMRSETR